MAFNHQPQLSINSVQSLVEPITPPLGQMNNKQNHQRTHSLDLSGFNKFISNSNNSPLNLLPVSPGNTLSGVNVSTPGTINGCMKPRLPSLPLISEFNSMNLQNSKNTTFVRAVSDSTVSSNSTANHNNRSMSSSSLNTDLSGLPLEELDYLQLATDQYGCRFLQKKLENPLESNTVRDLMFSSIKLFLLDLILDPFGNYLIQKLCEYLTLDQKTLLIKNIYPNVFQISINQYGTRSLQKIIDTVETEEHVNMICDGFSTKFTSIEQVVTLINDLNGNHVIQKCIFKFSPSKFGFIIDAIVNKDNIIKISTHKHGCCVLQKLLSVCTLQQIFKISVKIIQYLPGLINDQFGNYIIQFLFDIKELDFYLLGEIFGKLSHELGQLSCLKFSSNVVEKFIKKLFGIIQDLSSNDYISSNLQSTLDLDNGVPIDDVASVAMCILLTITDIFTVNLNLLIRDNFGNYALQTLLDVRNYSHLLEYPGNNNIHNSSKLTKFSHEFTLKVGNLIVLTKELLPTIKTTSYAKKIKLKLKAYAELTGIPFTDLSPKNNSMDHGNRQRQCHQPINNTRKQHTRHYSLPSNSGPGGFSNQQLSRAFNLPDVYNNQPALLSQHQTLQQPSQQFNPINNNNLPFQPHSQVLMTNKLQIHQGQQSFPLYHQNNSINDPTIYIQNGSGMNNLFSYDHTKLQNFRDVNLFLSQNSNLTSMNGNLTSTQQAMNGLFIDNFGNRFYR